MLNPSQMHLNQEVLVMTKMYMQICNREIGVETVENTAASNIIKKLFCWKKICQKSRTVELSIVHMDLSINLRCL